MSDEPLPRKYAALFMDVPNLTHHNEENGKLRRYDIEEINWPVLIDRMLESLDSDHFLFTGRAYLFAGDGRKRTSDWLERSMRSGLGRYRKEVTTFVRSVKDIDVAIVNDMWESFFGMLRMQQDMGAKPPFEVTFLLAGGDGAYTYPIKSLRALITTDIKLHVHTFSWSESLSKELSHESVITQHLEKIWNIIRKMPTNA